ncbi:MAG: universal stress protein [Trichloromonas sp.]|nr:universal stress protein [Trichloromonas sp.]
MIEGGNLTELLQDLAESSSIDLVVLDSRVRGLLPETFVGSVAKHVVSALPGGALVSRGQKA